MMDAAAKARLDAGAPTYAAEMMRRYNHPSAPDVRGALKLDARLNDFPPEFVHDVEASMLALKHDFPHAMMEA